SATRTEHLFPGHLATQQQVQQYLQAHPRQPLSAELGAVYGKLTQDTVAGWSAGFLVAAGLLATAAVVFRVLVHVSKEQAAAALKDAMAAG
ncbi:MAG TPA: hypothetical protein VL281_08280, partial [Mycobacteriales bacterium]|nr:hypothetical protein [Mycobacteriales bacterium]